MNKVYLGLGSNLGDRHKNLDTVLKLIGDNVGEVLKVSSIFETEPEGFVSENMFVNAACLVTTSLSPIEVLEKTQEIEKTMGRSIKSHDKIYIDRIIDIDILLFNEDIIDIPQLKLPHEHLHERSFVIRPLSEIASQVNHPILHKTIGELNKEYEKQVVNLAVSKDF